MTLEQLFAGRGVAIIEHALSSGDLTRMGEAFAGASPAGNPHHPVGDELTAWLTDHDVLSRLAARLVPAGYEPQLASIDVGFERGAASWLAGWQQLARHETAIGFSAASLQRPKLRLLVHLDPCDEDDGPLEVLPGSHVLGPLGRARRDAAAGMRHSMVCLAARGDILALDRDLVFRRQRARRPRPYRLLCLDYRYRLRAGQPASRRH